MIKLYCSVASNMEIWQVFAIIRIDKVAVRDLTDWHTAAQRYAPKCARHPTCLTVLNPKDPPSHAII